MFRPIRGGFALLRSNTLARLAFVAILVCFGALAMSGCSQKSIADKPDATGSVSNEASPAPDADAADPTQEGALYTPSYKPSGEEVAVIKTSKGTVEVKLFGKDAPIHVGNFVELAQKGFYDGVKFHRLEPGFVIQGGDPQTKELDGAQVAELVNSQKSGAYAEGQPMLGTGGPGYTIKGEFDASKNPNKHIDGSLAMARSQSPDSGGSQFYFTLGPQSFLDGQYTVFGQTTEGLEVVHKLGVGDEIVSVTIENANK